jgi:hypothetical protein
MNATPDANTYFYVCFEGADLKFGVPTKMARDVADSTRAIIRKGKVTPANAMANGEKAIADAFRRDVHRNPKASKKIAPFIISCCLMSREAQENPDARAFILEISRSTVPSWATDPDGAGPEDGAGTEPRTYAHYKALAGREEIDAFLASRSAGAG